jgi:hypothetical protein
MEQLILALQIFLKYGNPSRPTNCDHDELTICGISPDDVSEEDKKKLAEFGFFVSESDNCFKSFKYGSA